MGATIAIVRPETDATEVTMSSWAAAYLAAIAGDPDVSLRHDIAGRTATQAAISAAAQSVDALLYYGHGRKDRLGDTTTLVDSSNYSDYKDKVLVAVACLAGDRFGPDVVGTGGAKGFLGFDDILIVYKGQASLFGGVFERALLALSQQGGTLKTASDVLQKGFRDLENYFLNDPKGRTHPDAAIIWLGAHINYRGAVLYGQPSAQLSSAHADEGTPDALTSSEGDQEIAAFLRALGAEPLERGTGGIEIQDDAIVINSVRIPRRS